MNYCILLLIVIIALQGKTFGAQLDLKANVAEQVNRIRSTSGYSEQGFFELPGVSLHKEDSPVSQLINYGMEVIPYLIPYLSDSTPTQAYRTHGNGRKRRALINEYIIFIISKIAEHEFYLPPELDGAQIHNTATVGVPRDITELENQIRIWWQQNQAKSLLERKLNDLDDPIHNNRFSAYEWLGRERVYEGRIQLEERINSLLIGPVDTLKQSEMAACAESLSQIGDSKSVQAVRKVCEHLSYWIYMSYRPVEEGRSGVGSGQISTLFKAYQALARLGFKEEAISHLEEIKMKYLKEMELSFQEEFLDRLQKATGW